MAALYNDGSVPFGSRTEVINGTTYVLESITLTYPAKVIERPNEIGEPNGWVAVAGFSHGTAVLQLADTATPLPKQGDNFSDDFGNGVEKWVITEMSRPFAMHDYYKFNLTLKKATS